jgi:hypothetical protein
MQMSCLVIVIIFVSVIVIAVVFASSSFSLVFSRPFLLSLSSLVLRLSCLNVHTGQNGYYYHVYI